MGEGSMRQTSAVLGGAAALIFSAGLVIAGCGGGGVNVPEGPMPEGGSFTGVWHSPQYGRMQMVQTGNNVIGEYVKDERTGRIQGTARGNVLRFEWTEERELVAGRPVVTRGLGYFRYSIGEDGDHYITGEWGIDDNRSGGGEWNAVRDRRARPELSDDGSGGSAADEGFEEFDTADDSGGGTTSGGSDSGGGDDSLDLEGL